MSWQTTLLTGLGQMGLVFCYQNCSDLLFRKNCSSDREKLLKFEAEGREFFSILKYNCSNILDLRNLQEQVIFFCRFSAFCLKSQKLFSITRTIFSHSRSEQFWKQNTISHLRIKILIDFIIKINKTNGIFCIL